MTIAKGINRFRGLAKGVLTLGNFDGFHLGHQKIIKEVVSVAKKAGRPAVLLTFEPHTQAVLSVGSSYPVLTTPREKAWLLKDSGIDHLIFLKFTRRVQKMPAETFFREVVLKYIKPSQVILGYDHRFGKGREGDFGLIKNLCKSQRISVKRILPYELDNKVISSTLIRELIAMGKPEPAAALLGHPYVITGKVVRGRGKGRQMGFPTANLQMAPEKRLLPDGVYTGSTVVSGERVPSMISIGTRPTFGGYERSVETFLLDFDRDLYGKYLTLLVDQFVRKQVKLKGQKALTEKIRKDVDFFKHTLQKEEAIGRHN